MPGMVLGTMVSGSEVSRRSIYGRSAPMTVAEESEMVFLPGMSSCPTHACMCACCFQVLGISLGTQSSAIAFLPPNAQGVQLVANEASNLSTPSTVSFGTQVPPVSYFSSLVEERLYN